MSNYLLVIADQDINVFRANMRFAVHERDRQAEINRYIYDTTGNGVALVESMAANFEAEYVRQDGTYLGIYNGFAAGLEPTANNAIMIYNPSYSVRRLNWDGFLFQAAAALQGENIVAMMVANQQVIDEQYDSNKYDLMEKDGFRFAFPLQDQYVSNTKIISPTWSEANNGLAEDIYGQLGQDDGIAILLDIVER